MGNDEMLKRTVRHVLWPFFQMLAVLGLILVATSIYFVSQDLDGSSDTTGFIAGTAVRTTDQRALNLLPPPTPDGMRASDGTFTTHVRVAWNNVANALSYTVYRGTTNNPAAASVFQSGVLLNPIQDTSAVPGTIYYYWVRAVNANGMSGFSDPDSGYRGVSPVLWTRLPSSSELGIPSDVSFFGSGSRILLGAKEGFGGNLDVLSAVDGGSLHSAPCSSVANNCVTSVSDAGVNANTGVWVEHYQNTSLGTGTTIVHRYTAGSSPAAPPAWTYTFPFNTYTGVPRVAVVDTGKIAVVQRGLFAPNNGNRLALFDPASPTPSVPSVYAPIFSTRIVEAMRLSENGSTLALTSGDNGFQMKIYDVSGPTPVERFADTDLFVTPYPGQFNAGPLVSDDDCVALSQNGGTLVYGYGLVTGTTRQLRVYVAERQANGSYSKITLTNNTNNAPLFCLASISEDGTRIGLTLSDETYTNTIDVKMLQRSGNTWSNTPTTILNYTIPYQSAGTSLVQSATSISMNASGTTLAVGSTGDGTWNQSTGTPTVHVFKPAQNATGPVFTYKTSGSVTDLDLSSNLTEDLVVADTQNKHHGIFGTVHPEITLLRP